MELTRIRCAGIPVTLSWFPWRPTVEGRRAGRKLLCTYERWCISNSKKTPGERHSRSVSVLDCAALRKHFCFLHLFFGMLVFYHWKVILVFFCKQFLATLREKQTLSHLSCTLAQNTTECSVFLVFCLLLLCLCVCVYIWPYIDCQIPCSLFPLLCFLPSLPFLRSCISHPSSAIFIIVPTGWEKSIYSISVKHQPGSLRWAIVFPWSKLSLFHSSDRSCLFTS